MTKRVFIYNVGCKLRLLDAKRLSEYLSLNNYKIVDNIKEADIIVLFTCGALDSDTKRSFANIKKLKKYPGELIVVGCVPETDKEDIKKIFDGKMLSTKDLNSNPEKVDELFNVSDLKFRNFKEISEPISSFKKLGEIRHKRLIKLFFNNFSLVNRTYLEFKDILLKKFIGDNTLSYEYLSKNPQYNIRISWGCLGNCSYCAIKKAIGNLQSKPVQQIIDDFRNGIRQGYSNFCLTSDDTGAYGLDIGHNLPYLLERLMEIPGEYKISIVNLKPKWLVKYNQSIKKILTLKKIKLLDIPIQSGSSRILKLMNRYSDVKRIENAFNIIKNADPDVVIGTQVLLGFPTETSDDIDKTLSMIDYVNFDSGMLFQFYCKKDTPAESLTPKLSDNQIKHQLKYAKKGLKSLGYKVRKVNSYSSDQKIFCFIK